MADKSGASVVSQEKTFSVSCRNCIIFMFDYGDRDTGGGLPTSGISVLFRGNGKVNVLWSGRSADRT